MRRRILADCFRSMTTKRVFVTVGSTHFTELIQAVLSERVLRALHDRQVSTLVVQCGKYELPAEKAGSDGVCQWDQEGVHVVMWQYKKGIEEDIKNADWIISHAGIVGEMHYE